METESSTKLTGDKITRFVERLKKIGIDDGGLGVAVFEQLLIGDISKNVVHGYRDKGEGTIVESHSIADHEKDSV